MNQFIVNTKYAVENLISIMQKERMLLEEKLSARKIVKDAEKNLFEQMKENDFFSPEGIIDLYGLNSATERIEKETEELRNFLLTIDDSLRIIAGALLQIAKQGISFTHKSLGNCPTGRVIGRETLKNIIWQSRNQAMHFEEGRYRSSVVNCFKNLEIDYGTRFELADKSLAYEIIKLLEWDSYDNYESDMKLLLP